MAKDRSDEMQAALDAQRAAFTAARPEELNARRDRLKRLIALLQDRGHALSDAMSADFGNRAETQSLLTDIGPTISLAKYCLSRLSHWAKPQKRGVQFPLGLLGAKAEVRFEPLGVIGIVSPWNFPVGLTFSPLAQAFAAGNRAMIKPSELTPRTSDLMAELIGNAYASDECAVFTGGPDVAQAFTKLKFDHILFTGSTATGRKVMQAAADNLVPVTLELGGKSPVFVGSGADLHRAGERIAMGKMMNAGQICLAPDYLCVPEERELDTIAEIAASASAMYPTLLDNSDYASLVSDRHFERLQEMVADARDKGAEVLEVNPAQEDFGATNARKMPLTILQNVSDDMLAMQEEIFGPVLPVKTYGRIEEAIDYVNGCNRPLGLYYFGDDAGEREKVLGKTISGGVTVNDVIYHVSADDLPFGGVGASGMGSYHGPEGFRTFSHARSVYTQPKLDVAGLAGLKPPYGEKAKKTIKRMAGI